MLEMERVRGSNGNSYGIGSSDGKDVRLPPLLYPPAIRNQI